MDKKAAIEWLNECAKYFDRIDTKGEDLAHWAAVYNAENARRVATLLNSGVTESRGDTEQTSQWAADQLSCLARIYNNGSDEYKHISFLIRIEDWLHRGNWPHLALQARAVLNTLGYATRDYDPSSPLRPFRENTKTAL